MSAPTPAPTRPDAPTGPSWGLAEVAIAAVATLFISTFLGSVVLSVAGVEDTDDASLALIALLQTTLWVGMLGSVLVVLRRRGGRLGADLGLRAKVIDVPLGIALGVACQLILVPAVSWPWTTLLGRRSDELREPACRLAEKADDPVGIALLFLITVIGAPIVEELFFRGFVQRPLVARLGRPVGLVLTAVLFGLTHFQLLQLPALVVFGLVLGLLAERTGRLGPSIVTHMAFNATTVVTLLLLQSSLDDQCRSVLGAVL